MENALNGDDMGAWELPEELVQLRDTVRRFMATEVRPIEDTLPHDAYSLPPDKLQQPALARTGEALVAALRNLAAAAEPRSVHYLYMPAVAGRN